MLKRLEADVAFAAFEGARICAVIAELVGELLLAQAKFFAPLAQVSAEGLLQFIAHPDNSGPLLLMDLQTYK